jgi:hypothetical protein
MHDGLRIWIGLGVAAVGASITGYNGNGWGLVGVIILAVGYGYLCRILYRLGHEAGRDYERHMFLRPIPPGVECEVPNQCMFLDSKGEIHYHPTNRRIS